MSEITNVYEMRKNGVSCLDFNITGSELGFRVLNQPSIVSPKERYETITIPGRSGVLTQKEGPNVHDTISLTATCFIDSVFYYYNGQLHDRVAEITQWITGDGRYEFYGHGHGFYKGRLANQISFDRVVQGNPHKAFSLQFECEPYFYLFEGEDRIPNDPNSYIETNEYTITNISNTPSLPLLYLYGHGEAVVTVGGKSMTVNIDQSKGHIIIDSEAQIAYTEDPITGEKTFAGTRVSGEFPSIPVAESKIYKTYNSQTGEGIYGYAIKPRWRRK